MNILVGLARIAGKVKCAQIVPVAARLLPALGLVVPLVLGTSGVALAKRSYELQEVRTGKSGAAKVRHSRHGRHNRHRSFAKFNSPVRLGAGAHEGTGKSKDAGVQVASLNTGLGALPDATGKLAGLSKVSWGANAKPSCLPDRLKPIISHIAESFGTVRINSTCRSHEHNRSVGGASHSLHLIGQAVDFRLNGNVSGALKYLRTSSAGGIKHYGGGAFHIDTGPRRTW